MNRFLVALLVLCLTLTLSPLLADAGPKKPRDAKEAPGEMKTEEEKKAEAAKKRAEEKLRKAREKNAKGKVAYFLKELKSKKKIRRINAILEVSKTKHDLVIKALGEKSLVHRDEDIRQATASVLGDMDFNVELAGSYLRKAVMKNEDFPAIQRTIVIAIGRLKVPNALKELEDAASRLNEEKYKHVTVEVMRSMGKIGDPKCLPFLLWLSEYGGRIEKWSTGSVTVDTGTAGDGDQRAAEAKWKAKYGHVKPKKPKPPMIRLYMQELKNAVKKITGQEFENATMFRVWLISHARELGLDPKKLSKNR